MTDRLAKLGVGMLAACAIAIPVAFVATANAQQGGPQGGGVQGQNRFGQGQGQGQAQPGQQRPGFGGGGFGGFGGGGGAIAATDGAVYVLQGNRVYKLHPSSLAVVAQNELPAPQFQPGQFGGGAGQRGGNRGGGGGQQGGNTTPPPK
jgi:hypothetical protein